MESRKNGRHQKIPAIIKEITEKEITEIALIENLQREDLNPIEEARGYKELMETYYLTQDDIARKMGKSRSAVANCVRLLGLSETIQKLLIDKKMSTAELRKEIGIAPNTLTRLKKDEEVSLAVLNKICSTLNVDIGDIMEFLPDKSLSE